MTDPMQIEEILAVDVEAVKAKMLRTSKKNSFKEQYDVRYYEKINLTVAEYLALIFNDIVIKSIKTNRPDVNDKSKKQGILDYFFKDSPIQNFIVSVYYLDEHGAPLPHESKDQAVNIQIRVCDGGHRSRTLDEFVRDLIELSKTQAFVNEMGQTSSLGDMTASEIRSNHPKAWSAFMNYEIELVVWRNSTPTLDALETIQNNKSTEHNDQEQRNTLDDNVVAEFVRNTTRVVEEVENEPHRLFDEKFIGFKAGRLDHDEVLSRFMFLIEKKDPTSNVLKDDLDAMFYDGSVNPQDPGRYCKFEKEWKTLARDTNRYIDTIAKIYDHYPKTIKKLARKSKINLTALFRFLMTVENNCFEKMLEVRIEDYEKFATEWVALLETIYNDQTLNDWLNNGTNWTKAEAFKKYLGQFNTVKKTVCTIQWMQEVFQDRYEDFGMKRIDKRVSFHNDDIAERAAKVGYKCECCGVDVNSDNVQGDHDIPRNWGVDKGGWTEPEFNLRILCATCNNKKSDKYSFNEFVKFFESQKEAA